MPESLEYVSPDRFERAREAVWGTPGFMRRQTTITADGTQLFPSATWVIQTVMTDDAANIFLESMSSEGGQRIVLPSKVVRTIFRHYDELKKRRRSLGAQRAAETRKTKQRKSPEPGTEA